MSETTAKPAVCVVCNGSDSKHLVDAPGIEKIQDILHYATRLADIGEVNLRPLAHFLASLPHSELEQVRYHSICRKTIVNKPFLERAQKRRDRSDSPSPAQPYIREVAQPNRA